MLYKYKRNFFNYTEKNGENIPPPIELSVNIDALIEPLDKD